MSLVVGLICTALCVVLFGSFALPTKTAKTGDGVFFQWCMCSAIFMVGIVVHFYQCGTERNAGIQSAAHTCPQFEPLASLGGAIWCTANLLLVPLVDSIGVGMTMMLWGLFEMMAGWLTGRVPLFGVNQEPVSSLPLNYVGIALAFISLLIILLVRPNVVDKNTTATLLPTQSTAINESDEPLLPKGALASPSIETKHSDRMSPWQKRVFGGMACCIAGSLSGSTFTPAQYIVDRTNDSSGGGLYNAPFPGASTDLLDHIFAHFTGIWLTSSVYFIAYLLLGRFRVVRVQLYADEILPYMTSGFVWGVAMVCWFLANANLSIVIAFPMVTMGPGLVSVLWGVVLYKEISGLRNYVLLAASICVLLAGSVCIVLSKS